jgi:hypothetical protein
MGNVGGPIPCEGCHCMIVTGTVYKIADETFICESCYEKAQEMYTEKNNGLKQFEESD